jgi:hypothetical protein
LAQSNGGEIGFINMKREDEKNCGLGGLEST